MTNILSPFVKVEESFQFYVNGRVFEMNNSNEIKEIEGNTINSELKTAITAFESFEFSNETIKWFNGPSKFVYNLKENTFYDYIFHKIQSNLTQRNSKSILRCPLVFLNQPKI